MRYAYHFEFCERPELPNWLREDLFTTLGWVQTHFGLKAVLSKALPSLIDQQKTHMLIELGSGSGVGLKTLMDGLSAIHSKTTSLHTSGLATDLFPQSAAWKQLFQKTQAQGYSKPVAFENFPQCMPQTTLKNAAVLLTTASHHLDPVQAKALLERCAPQGLTLYIVEPLERDFKGLVLGAAAGIPALVAPLLMKWRGNNPLSLLRRLRLAVTHWLFPIIPLILTHDGVVSAFRQRTASDWQALCKGLPYTATQLRGLGVFKNFSVTTLQI